jgi:hypothetical protein
MRSDFHEKRQRQINTAYDLAQKHQQKATQFKNQFHTLSDLIPIGQPILIGHHSEKRHRNHLRKIDSALHNSVIHSDLAEKYNKKASRLNSDTSISSDDPDALDKLEKKKSRLIADRTTYKEINKIVRQTPRNHCTPEKMDTLKVQFGLSEKTILSLFVPSKVHGTGLPTYVLSNLSNRIKSIQARIDSLKNQKGFTMSFPRVKVVGSIKNNRVQMFFNEKPPADIRKQLKSSGFRWSPSAGAWQRHLSNAAKYHAEQIAKSFSGE